MAYDQFNYSLGEQSIRAQENAMRRAISQRQRYECAIRRVRDPKAPVAFIDLFGIAPVRLMRGNG